MAGSFQDRFRHRVSVVGKTGDVVPTHGEATRFPASPKHTHGPGLDRPTSGVFATAGGAVVAGHARTGREHSLTWGNPNPTPSPANQSTYGGAVSSFGRSLSAGPPNLPRQASRKASVMELLQETMGDSSRGAVHGGAAVGAGAGVGAGGAYSGHEQPTFREFLPVPDQARPVHIGHSFVGAQPLRRNSRSAPPRAGDVGGAHYHAPGQQHWPDHVYHDSVHAVPRVVEPALHDGHEHWGEPLPLGRRSSDDSHGSHLSFGNAASPHHAVALHHPADPSLPHDHTSHHRSPQRPSRHSPQHRTHTEAKRDAKHAQHAQDSPYRNSHRRSEQSSKPGRSHRPSQEHGKRKRGASRLKHAGHSIGRGDGGRERRTAPQSQNTRPEPSKHDSIDKHQKHRAHAQEQGRRKPTQPQSFPSPARTQPHRKGKARGSLREHTPTHKPRNRVHHAGNTPGRGMHKQTGKREHRRGHKPTKGMSQGKQPKHRAAPKLLSYTDLAHEQREAERQLKAEEHKRQMYLLEHERRMREEAERREKEKQFLKEKIRRQELEREFQARAREKARQDKERWELEMKVEEARRRRQREAAAQQRKLEDKHLKQELRVKHRQEKLRQQPYRRKKVVAPRKVDFQPYTLQDYRALKATPVETGSLGPNLTPEVVEKKRQQEEVRKLAYAVRVRNARKTERANATRQPSPPPKPPSPSAREKALEFAKSVPRPRVRAQEGDSRQDAATLHLGEEGLPKELAEVSAKYQAARSQVDAIRRQVSRA